MDTNTMEKRIIRKFIKKGIELEFKDILQYVLKGNSIFDLPLNDDEIKYILFDCWDILNYNGDNKESHILYYNLFSNEKDINKLYRILLIKSKYPFNLYFEMFTYAVNNHNFIPSLNVKFTVNDTSALDAQLDTLTDNEKNVIIMRFKDGKTFTEIASIIGLSKSRVTQIMYKAVRRLKHPTKLRHISSPHNILDIGLSEDITNVLLDAEIFDVDGLNKAMITDKLLSIRIPGITVEMVNTLYKNKFISNLAVREFNREYIYAYNIVSDIDLIVKSKEITNEDKEAIIELVHPSNRYNSEALSNLICRYSSETIKEFINEYIMEVSRKKREAAEEAMAEKHKKLEASASLIIENVREDYRKKYTDYLKQLKEFQEREYKKTEEHFHNMELLKDSVPVHEQMIILQEQIALIKRASQQIIKSSKRV